MKFNPHEAEACSRFGETLTGQKLEEFIEFRIRDYQSSISSPTSISSFFEREQTLGKITELRELLSAFTTIANQQLTEYEHK